MHRILILLILTLSFVPAHSAQGEPLDQSGAVLPLLEILTDRENRARIETAVLQLITSKSPTEALAAARTAEPNPMTGRMDLNSEAGRALANLGQYIASHPAEFAAGLPDLSGFHGQLQLGPLFEGMLSLGWSKQITTGLDALDPLITDSWLDAALRCGALDLYHRIRAHRGQIRDMLLTYQQAGDEVGIIRLGEAIGRYAEPARGIDSRGFSTRTLALFLSGAFGADRPEASETFILVAVTQEWRQVHPELLNSLMDLHGDRSSLLYLEVADLWSRGQRESALKRLYSKTKNDSWTTASFVNPLLLQANPPDDEAASLIRLIPTDILVSCARQLLDDEKFPDDKVGLARLMMPEFHSRGDRKREHWIPYSMDYARKTALRWWMEGRNDEAYRLLLEVFVNLRPEDRTDDMLRFAAIAHAFGKEEAAMEEINKRAANPAYTDLTLHKAALLTVAGKHREALALARSRQPGALFFRLLVECGDWDELRKIAFGPDHPFKERDQWLCHAAFLNRDATSARAYFNGLSDKGKEQTAMLLVLSGNDELCREHAQKVLSSPSSYFSLPFPISLRTFDLWERSILDDMDAARAPLFELVERYTAHVGMTRNKANTIQVLVRLAKTGKLRTNHGGADSAYFAEKFTWQHRIRAAHGLIELGAVELAGHALGQMEKEGAGGIENLQHEFWAAFLPGRFTTNGYSEYLKIAELELPLASKHDRHLFLAGILAGNPSSEAVRRMLALLEKHRSAIPLKDASLLLQKMSIALFGAPGAEGLRSEAERVFAFYQPNEKQAAFFQRWARPAPWQDVFTSHTTIEEKPGSQWHPKGETFRVLDGMAELRSLLANQRAKEAASLFRDMEIRILLDELPREKINVNTRTNEGTSGSGGDQHAVAIPLLAAQLWNLQAPFLSDYALTAWRCDWDINPRYLAPYLAKNGDFHEARIAAIEYQHGQGSDDLKIIRMLPAIDGLAHASEGRVDAALDRLGVCLNLSPFDPSSGMAILNAFKQRGDERAAQQAAARIRDYWNQRLKEYPDSPQVREASHYWLGELGKSH